MNKITADVLYAGGNEVVEDFVLIYDDSGCILEVQKNITHPDASVRKFEGWITPGFVNAHCHLELSHMKGLVPTGTGLINFVNDVVTKRDQPEDAIREAIDKAIEEMRQNGIVALGDISNTKDTFEAKTRGDLYYHTFVEMFDLMQPQEAMNHFQQYRDVFVACPNDDMNSKSTVPHAPYSVSPQLFELMAEYHSGDRPIVSIHNQEIIDENLLFLEKGGAFPDWYGSFGLKMEHFVPTGKTSIHYALDKMRPECPTIFVHNTQSSLMDLKAAEEWGNEIYWCTCPNANLYIENHLPNYAIFLEAGVDMIVGTDSLTSNWQLCVLEELKTIKKYASYVPTITLLKWGITNGAYALGVDKKMGVIREGMTPGINVISHIEAGELTGRSTVTRIS